MLGHAHALLNLAVVDIAPPLMTILHSEVTPVVASTIQPSLVVQLHCTSTR